MTPPDIEFLYTRVTNGLCVYAKSDLEGTDYVGQISRIGEGFDFTWVWGSAVRYTPEQQALIQAAADEKAAVLTAIRRLTA